MALFSHLVLHHWGYELISTSAIVNSSASLPHNCLERSQGGEVLLRFSFLSAVLLFEIQCWALPLKTSLWYLCALGRSYTRHWLWSVIEYVISFWNVKCQQFVSTFLFPPGFRACEDGTTWQTWITSSSFSASENFVLQILVSFLVSFSVSSGGYPTPAKKKRSMARIPPFWNKQEHAPVTLFSQLLYRYILLSTSFTNRKS